MTLILRERYTVAAAGRLLGGPEAIVQGKGRRRGRRRRERRAALAHGSFGGGTAGEWISHVVLVIQNEFIVIVP
ncbi:MAG: hypothetical protein CMM02_21345 [Rhodopirellula sp.]|nr:hypothetical protein [Rhodopirellula sp.]